MAYTFPIIEHIDQVLPYVKDREDFVVGQWDNEFILVDYTTIVTSTFKSEDPIEAAMLRECRGFLFHTDGSIARRAFHKFFNLNEMEETTIDRLNDIEPVAIMEKLDGSMVAPFVWPETNEIYWASMRGSKPYHEMLAPQYNGTNHSRLVEAAHQKGLTAIFEYCAPDNRIVVSYGETKLVLTGLRDKTTGIYVTYEELLDWGTQYGVPVVSLMNVDNMPLSDLVEHVWKMEGEEGSVIRFSDNTLTKLKGEWYIQLHKLLSYFEFEKDIAWLILSEKEDDLIGILQEDKKIRLEEYRDGLRHAMNELGKELKFWVAKIDAEEMDRKTFAILKEGPHHVVKSIIFKNWDNLEAIDISKSLTSFAFANTNRGVKWDTFKKGNGIDLIWTEETLE